MAVQEYFIRFGSGNPATVSGLAPTFILFRNYLGSNITSPSLTEIGATSGIYGFTYNATQTICFTADGNTSSLSSSDRYVSGALGVIDSVNNNVLGISSQVADFGSSFVAYASTFNGLNSTFTAFNSTFIAFNSSFVAVGNTVLSNGEIGLSLTANVNNLGSTVIAIGDTLLALGLSNAVYASLGDLYSLIGSTASTYGDSTTDPSTVFGYLKRSIELFEGQQQFLKTTGSLTFFDRNASYTLRGFTITDSSSSTERV